MITNKTIIIDNHVQTVKALREEIAELSNELVQSYRKEEKFLKILTSRDAEIARLTGKKKESSSKPGRTFEEADSVGELRRKYQALSSSKLGRLQIGYWIMRKKWRNK